MCPERRIKKHREESQVELGTETRVMLQVPCIPVISQCRQRYGAVQSLLKTPLPPSKLLIQKLSGYLLLYFKMNISYKLA